MRIGVVLGSRDTCTPTHTTVHLVAAALARGHSVRVIDPWDLELDERGRGRARATSFDALAGLDELAAGLRARAGERRLVDARALDVLVLRTNPLDVGVLTLAQLIAAEGIPVVNDPNTLVRTSHKAWLASLPASVPRPRTLVTRSAATAEAFASTCADGVVIKPARSSGGRGVAWVPPRGQVSGAFEAAGSTGDGLVVVQAYLSAASRGEKRLLWLEGELLGGYLRQRAEGEFRHNLKAGAQPEPCKITDGERAAVAALSPFLHRERVWFAGLDLIGEHIVEVNILNPGGAHHTTALGGVPVGERLVQSLESRAARASAAG